MFIFTWLFDKIGYMPKVTIDSNWHFPVQKPHEFKEPAKKTAKKTVTKATTRPKKK